jgi:uncharacterized protein (DUF2267 family)
MNIAGFGFANTDFSFRPPTPSTIANHLQGSSLTFQARRKGTKPMSATGLDVFDRTIHLTNAWLDEIIDWLEQTPASLRRDKHMAWHTLGAVLRAVRDRVPLELAAHLGAQLPLLVRGTYYDQWRPSETPQKWRTAEEFLAVIAADLISVGAVSLDDVADAADAVFRVLNRHVDPGQLRKIRQALPEEIRALWPENNDQGRRTRAA